MDTDGEGMGIDLAVRAQEAGHDVRYWLPTRAGEALPYGDGIVEKVAEWEPEMDRADLIVLIGNSTYTSALAPYFGKGYPILGSNAKAAELELDRAKGQEVLAECGVETIPYQIVDSCEEAIALICKTGKAYAMKSWGGEADKATTCVASSADEAIFTLLKWEETGCFKGQLMMQERVEGVEMGIAGWFGPGGWSGMLEESFEHKKLMNDNLGPNTGEMGSVQRQVKNSKLFEIVLAPLTDYLHSINYVGDCSVNCIIDEDGTPWPLEFTMRLGWPNFCIRQALLKGDPCGWMLDLVLGQDTFQPTTEIALGVLLCHGDFPAMKDAPEKWSGFPIEGITSRNFSNIHFQQAMFGKAPRLEKRTVVQKDMYLTAGQYVMIVSGTGKSVTSAQRAAYDVAWNIDWPSDLIFRTDVGDRLEDDLPKIQRHGFATAMKF